MHLKRALRKHSGPVYILFVLSAVMCVDLSILYWSQHFQFDIEFKFLLMGHIKSSYQAYKTKMINKTPREFSLEGESKTNPDQKKPLQSLGHSPRFVPK